MQLLCCHGVTQVCEKVTGIGVIDQHRHRADHYREVHKVFPAEATPDLGLVAGAAEHHRHVDGRVEEQRPGRQWEQRGGEEDEEEEEEGRPRAGRMMSPGKCHGGSLVPAEEEEDEEEEEGREKKPKDDKHTHKLLYWFASFYSSHVIVITSVWLPF